MQAGLLALDLARIARQEAFPLERDPQLGIRLDERPGDAVANRAGLGIVLLLGWFPVRLSYHLAAGIWSFTRVMARPWPEVEPIEDWDDLVT